MRQPSSQGRYGYWVGLSLVVLCAASGCIGYVGEPDGDGKGGPGSSNTAACTSGSLAPLPTRRLTRYEYENTLRALLGEETYGALADTVAVVPPDRTTDALDTLSQQSTMSHIQAYFTVAEAIGAHYASNALAREAIHGCFAADDWARACVEQAIEAFAPRVLRRELEAGDAERLLALYDKVAGDGREQGLHAVISALFQAPDFLFRLEVRGELEDDVVTLTGRELANRLAYALWGEPPDDELISAADSGALDDDPGLKAEIERLLADPRARRHFTHFATQWLMLDHVDDIENPPEYLSDGLDLTGINSAVQDEIRLLVEHVVFDQGGGYHALLTTPLSFVQAPSLAALYGVSESSGSDPITLGPERAGLLTRLAFLANTDGVSDPIHRGKRIRTQLLCGELQQPDPSTLPAGSLEPPALDATMTTRERVSQKTASAECKSCHDLINPLGFAMEDFDGLGRQRSLEQIYDPAGELLAELPVDASVDPMFEKAGEHVVNGARELSQALAADPRAVRCLASRYLEFVAARPPASADACSLDDLSARAAGEDGSIAAMISGFAELDAFRRKRIDDGDQP